MFSRMAATNEVSENQSLTDWFWKVIQVTELSLRYVNPVSRSSLSKYMPLTTAYVESDSESRLVVSDSLWTHEMYSPWNSPGQNSGVGSLSLLQHSGRLGSIWKFWQNKVQGGPPGIKYKRCLDCLRSFVQIQLLHLTCCCCYVTLVVSDSVRPHRWQPTRLPRPWDSPGKNTGVGCCFLLQCMKVKSLGHVQLFSIPWTAAYQAPPPMGFSRQEYWSGVPSPSPSSNLEAYNCQGQWLQPRLTLLEP